MSRRLAAITAVAALALPGAAKADWPVYGHDLSNSRNAGSDGPSVSDVASMEQAWRFDSPSGDFTGTPVVAGGTLVAGTNLGTIHALDAVTGKQRWSREVGDQINGSAAIDTAAPGGAAAYVPVARQGSPHLIALSLADGSVRWDTVLSRDTDSYVYGSPTFWNGTIYIGTSGPNNDESTARGSVVAVDEATGAVRWQTHAVPTGHDGGAVWSTPAIDTRTGRIYVGTGNAYHEPAAPTTDAMLTLNAATGEVVGQFQATPDDVWQLNAPFEGPDHDFGASPNLITGPDGRALVGEGSKSGVYWALDRETMKPVWNTSVGPGSQVGGILASTAYDGSRIYGNDSINAGVWSLTRAGSSAWSSDDGGSAEFSPVAVANGVLFSATSSGFLVGRDAASGEVLTRLSLGGPTFGGISVVGKAVYASVGTGPMIEPLPQTDTSKFVGPGSIVAFGDTAQSGTTTPAATATSGKRDRAQRLSLAPRRVQPGREVVFRFRALRGERPVAGVTVRFAGHRARTDRSGRAAMRVRLRRAKTYHAVASGRRFGRATTTVVARRGRSAPQQPTPPADAPRKPLTFTGSCDFSGAVRFTPAMTNDPQDIKQVAEVSGPCNGTLVARDGHSRDLQDVQVTYRATSYAKGASCGGGTAEGDGTLTFPDGPLAFKFSETRAGPAPELHLAGAASGSADGIARPAASQDPVATAEACGGAGLEQFSVDAHLETTPTISG